MYCLILKTQLKPGSFAQFMEAMRVNAAASVQNEPDCLVFDVVQDLNDPDLVYLYELYRDELAFTYHKTTEHYLQSRPLVGEYIVKQEAMKGRMVSGNSKR
ncbi:antibiotic biosynthesis monooxygenase [Pseudomonas stutzeri]|uniref:putative quinol monooxygenase n=1 Tax=Stutzerimonas stutzeri TaxID=316 RepID=UPI00210989C5|nr:putative quinol monooxygenase [Stutzerimonas stutzeri]MCQ4289453.1 antibiotic biosynthesis monooxygenase [Stutzerimonas stutzeri]